MSVIVIQTYWSVQALQRMRSSHHIFELEKLRRFVRLTFEQCIINRIYSLFPRCVSITNTNFLVMVLRHKFRIRLWMRPPDTWLRLRGDVKNNIPELDTKIENRDEDLLIYSIGDEKNLFTGFHMLRMIRARSNASYSTNEAPQTCSKTFSIE